MSYFKPYVDESGLHYPNYDDILENLVDVMQTIYGAGIYLGSDSKDYQMLSMFAQKIYDTYQAMEISYNAHSPVTAIGTGLDYVVAINGIKRKAATRSTAELTLTGTAGTVINNGKVMDGNGNLWDLPEQVTIGAGGTVTVEAICEIPGDIQAAEDTITIIATPTLGWESVTNESDSETGYAVETDSELRARQAESVAQPSRSILVGLKGALQDIDDVSRVDVYENDTDVTDDNGIPSHSICCVVEGGTDEDVADVIRLHKGLGCGTYGNETVTVQDEQNQNVTIKFSRAQYVDIDITINVTPKAGFAASAPTEIAVAIVNYLSTFASGTDLSTSIIWMVAQQINTDIRNPSFSITSVLAARHGETQAVGDVEIEYDEVVRGSVTNITVNVAE